MPELNRCLPRRLVTSELSRHAVASAKEVAKTEAHARASSSLPLTDPLWLKWQRFD